MTKTDSINIRSCQPGQLITKQTCLERVKAIYDRLGVPCPYDEVILNEMNID